MVPVPEVHDYDELNKHLLAGCETDLNRILRGKRSLTKGQLLIEDRAACLVLPDDQFDYRKSTSTFASSVSLVQYDTNDYPVPVSSSSDNDQGICPVYRGILTG